MISCKNDLCKSMMINVLFFTFIEKYMVAMRCYGYCSLVRVAELPTGENQNSKTWPTIEDQIQPVRSRGRKISILGPWLLDYINERVGGPLPTHLYFWATVAAATSERVVYAGETRPLI